MHAYQYMTKIMESPADLWRMRKQFALQIASTSFATHVLCLTGRLPYRFHLSRATGLIYMSEMVPCTQPHACASVEKLTGG